MLCVSPVTPGGVPRTVYETPTGVLNICTGICVLCLVPVGRTWSFTFTAMI